MLGQRMSRQRHQAGPPVSIAADDAAGGFQPVHLRHFDVEENQVVGMPLHGFENLAPVAGHVGRVAEPLQEQQRHLLVHGHVVGDQQAEGLDRTGAIVSVGRLRRPRRHGGTGCVRGERQYSGEDIRESGGTDWLGEHLLKARVGGFRPGARRC